MRTLFRKYTSRRALTLLLAAALVLGVAVASLAEPAAADDGAQSASIYLRLAVPDYMQNQVTPELLADFEAQHPGVQVVIENQGGGFGVIIGFGPGQSVDTYLNDQLEQVSEADVMLLSTSDLQPEATRAGYYLDLAPLANSDPDLNTGDFYPAVWQSVQWDGGAWMLPVSADAVLLFYDPEAFDAAGLPYPDTWRSMADFDFAVRTLTELNPSGTVASSGFQDTGSMHLLLLAASGASVVDPNTFPAMPTLADPALEDVVSTWAHILADGLMAPPDGGDAQAASFDTNVPLQISQTALASLGRGPQAQSESAMLPALLPGGRAGLVVQGFAVSAGTQYPELAYELARFLSQDAQVANAFLSGMPARQSMAGTSATTDAGSGIRLGGSMSEEVKAIMPLALASGISAQEAYFATPLDDAAQSMVSDSLDVQTALQEVELELVESLQTAAARYGLDFLAVTPPPVAQPLAPGEIALRFGVSSFINPLPNEDQWQALVADFVANDPQVGRVEIGVEQRDNLDSMAEEYDCFLLNNNAVQDADLALLRSLDPLLSSDPNYDPNDMIGSVMRQVTRDGQTWAMPLMIQPLAMSYDADIFNFAGVWPPDGGWGVDEFEMALRNLDSYLDADEIPFQPAAIGPDNSYLLMLIAAYGGLPMDYRTDPVTLNFTDPATVDAIRQVLDLVKAGYISYSGLSGGLGGITVAFSPDGEQQLPLTTVTFGQGFRLRGGPGGGLTIGGDTGNSVLITFPTGEQYNAVSYEVSAAYISAQTTYTDACYRFISAVAQSPELITAMPARRSLINDPALVTAQSQVNVDFYRQMDTLLQSPNTVEFPQLTASFGAASQVATNIWLNQAFDRYVLEDADLEYELSEAQLYSEAYLACVDALEQPAGGQQGPGQFAQQVLACALQVDPNVASTGFFGR